MPMVNSKIQVEVEMNEFDTYDLIKELESRDTSLAAYDKDFLEAIYQKRRLGQNFDKELDTLIYMGLGRIV